LPHQESDDRKIDLVITDVGGTLVKTDDAIIAAVKRAARELDIPDGYEEPVYDVFGTSIWEYVHAYLPDDHKARTDDVHALFWKLFPHEVLDQIAPFDGVEDALVESHGRGVRPAVLSGLRIESIEEILSILRFGHGGAVRSCMMYPTESGDSRAMGIRKLVEEFAADPARTIYIGDTDHDIRQARKAGVVSAVVKTGGVGPKAPRRDPSRPPHLLLSISARQFD
jgi:phosphoglycolate phosphatase